MDQATRTPVINKLRAERDALNISRVALDTVMSQIDWDDVAAREACSVIAAYLAVKSEKVWVAICDNAKP